MQYPCCVLCGEKDFTDGQKHWQTKHNRAFSDAIKMASRGLSEDKIDETILSQQYLDGNLSGYEHDGIDYDYKTVVMMRMLRDKDFMKMIRG